MRRVALVGAGFIARVHAEALQSVPNARVTVVVDPNRSAAESLARFCGGASTFGSIEEAVAAEAFDCAHILVPPNIHARAALPVLRAGKPVLLEKPMAERSEDCAELLAAAKQTGTWLGVNQNFLHHPAFARLQRMVEARTLGRPSHVSCIYNVPLRQLAARQFGHWMFQAPVNILLEQAVHPLSQIAAIAGPIGDVRYSQGRRSSLLRVCHSMPRWTQR